MILFWCYKRNYESDKPISGKRKQPQKIYIATIPNERMPNPLGSPAATREERAGEKVTLAVPGKGKNWAVVLTKKE